MREKEVLVLDINKRFLNYVHPAVARRLIKDKVAIVYARQPFVIQIVVEHKTSDINQKHRSK
jgi:hypothetical protein